MRWFRIQMFIAAMMFGLTASAGAYGYDYDFEQDGLFFRIQVGWDKTCVVTRGPRNNYYPKVIKIPDTVVYQGERYTVDEIEEYSFYEESWAISKIEIPESMRVIEENAFNCKIDSIIMKSPKPPVIYDDSFVARIYTDATVYVPFGTEALYKSKYKWNNFEKMRGNIANGIIYCDEMKYKVLSFNDSTCELTKIKDNDAIYIPEKVLGFSVVSIGEYVYRDSSYNYRLGYIEMPSTIKTIKKNAFADCTSLYEVVLSKNISTIGSDAFLNSWPNCFRISATEPPVVNQDAFDKFRYTTTVLIVPDGSVENYKKAKPWNVFRKIYDSSQSAKSFNYKGLLYMINPGDEQTCKLVNSRDTPYLRDYLSIPEYAEFDGKKYKVVEIGMRYGYGSSISSVKLPKSLEIIDEEAFFDLKLGKIEIPDKVYFIGREAFVCPYLEEVILGRNVSIIGEFAFREKANPIFNLIKKVYSKNPNPPLLLSHFGADYSKATLYVPKGSKELYQNADNWRYFRNIEEMDFPGGIDDVAADGDEMKVFAADGRVVVTGGDDDGPMEVYNLSGQLVYRGLDRSVELPQRGIYIVRLGGKAVKVAL